MTLPPKIELALGYLGGTEATRIREYIAELQEKLAQAKAEVARLQGFLAEDGKP